MTLLIAILVVVTVLNTVTVVALVHQVGLLSVRVQPIGALSLEEGPQVGDQLHLTNPPWEGNFGDDEARDYLIYLFSPTCNLCGQLLPGLPGLARRLEGTTEIVLATDASEESAVRYLQRRKVFLPLFVDHRLLKANDIPGVPFAVVVDPSGVVKRAGGINTLEQMESLLDSPGYTMDLLRSDGIGP